MDRNELDELYALALGWTDGDADRAAQLVSRYVQGDLDRVLTLDRALTVADQIDAEIQSWASIRV